MIYPSEKLSRCLQLYGYVWSEHFFHLPLDFFPLCILVVMLIDGQWAVTSHLCNHIRIITGIYHLRYERATGGIPCDVFFNAQHLACFRQGL